MNHHSNPACLEQLHRQAASQRNLEPLRASDHTDWCSPQRQLLAITTRWTWGASVTVRDARGVK
jgi:hypothetical protein